MNPHEKVTRLMAQIEQIQTENAGMKELIEVLTAENRRLHDVIRGKTGLKSGPALGHQSYTVGEDGAVG
jgi:hypothetical protein